MLFLNSIYKVKVINFTDLTNFERRVEHYNFRNY